MMDVAVRLYRTANKCFAGLGDDKGGRLVLSLFFKATLGVQRIFHFDSLSDVGFAWLTGGPQVLSRNTLGGLVRAVPTRAVNRFVKLTRPPLAKIQNLALSIDEHVVPRFTRKFLIRKGFHTIRNKHMRVEKLYFSFGIAGRSLLDLVVTRGNVPLVVAAKEMLAKLRRRVRSRTIRTALDAGAAKNHSQLLELVAVNKRHVFLVRTPRRPAYRKRWKVLPEDSFTRYEEPGRYTTAPPKAIHVAETTTTIRAEKHAPATNVRTIVVREEKRRGKDRWHALWIFGDDTTDPMDLISEFRARQHHEQTYRIMLHDAFVDTAPSGYNKKSPNPDRPGFRRNAITLYAWVTGLAVNAMTLLTHSLPERYHYAHPRTVRRWWFNVHADLYKGKDTLIVLLYPKWFRRWWEQRVERFNAKNVRVPWMDNRRIILSLAPRGTTNRSIK